MIKIINIFNTIKKACQPKWKVSDKAIDMLTTPYVLVEYWRNRYQRMNKERFMAANAMALITHTITQPLDLIKTRS